MDDTAPEHGLVWLVWEAYQYTRRTLDAVLAPYGITAAQLGVLVRLRGSRTGLTGAEVARQMVITPQAAHLALTALEHKGLVRRSPDPRHGRQVRASCTPEARRVVRVALAALRDVERQLESPLAPGKRAQLSTLLRRYIDGATQP